MFLIIKRKVYFISGVFAMLLLGFTGGSQAFHDASYESSAESSLIGSSVAANAYWWAGIDLYRPLSRSRNVDLFQSGFHQGSGEFNDKDFDVGLSVYRYWGPWFLVAALGGPTTSTETALRAALHGINLDTSVKLKRRVFGSLMVGYAFSPLNAASLSFGSSLSLESFSFLRQMSLELAGGAMISRDELKLSSDETVGSGVLETKKDRETNIEPMVEAALKFPMKVGDIRFGLTGYRVAGTNMMHNSSSFGFPYEVKVDDDWQWDFRLSYGMKF